MFICPVCGWDQLSENPEFATHEICSCCGTQFGYDDVPEKTVVLVRPVSASGEIEDASEVKSLSRLTTRDAVWASLREDWLNGGRNFWSSTGPPEGWCPDTQLKNLD